MIVQVHIKFNDAYHSIAWFGSWAILLIGPRLLFQTVLVKVPFVQPFCYSSDYSSTHSDIVQHTDSLTINSLNSVLINKWHTLSSHYDCGLSSCSTIWDVSSALSVDFRQSFFLIWDLLYLTVLRQPIPWGRQFRDSLHYPHQLHQRNVFHNSNIFKIHEAVTILYFGRISHSHCTYAPRLTLAQYIHNADIMW